MEKNDGTCGAKNPDGSICMNPPVPGRPRCSKHGCAKGAGGQPGNQNAKTHGIYCKEEQAYRREVDGIVDELSRLTDAMNNSFQE